MTWNLNYAAIIQAHPRATGLFLHRRGFLRRPVKISSTTNHLTVFNTHRRPRRRWRFSNYDQDSADSGRDVTLPQYFWKHATLVWIFRPDAAEPYGTSPSHASQLFPARADEYVRVWADWHWWSAGPRAFCLCYSQSPVLASGLWLTVNGLALLFCDWPITRLSDRPTDSRPNSSERKVIHANQRQQEPLLILLLLLQCLTSYTRGQSNWMINASIYRSTTNLHVSGSTLQPLLQSDKQ